MFFKVNGYIYECEKCDYDCYAPHLHVSQEKQKLLVSLAVVSRLASVVSCI